MNFSIRAKALPVTLTVAAAMLFSVVSVYAAPNLSLSNTGGDNVQVTVSGGTANSIVSLFYNIGGSSGTQGRVLGSTDNNGSFTSNISGSTYGISANTSAYVSINGQQSQTITWPSSGSSGGSNGLTLSQTTLNLNNGQSTGVGITGGSGNYFVSANSNPSKIQATTIGATLNLVSQSGGGSGTVSVCDAATATLCGTVTITSGGTTTNTGGITFSPSSVSLPLSGNQTVTISGGSNYFISTNTNPGIVSLTLNGSSLSMTATAAGSGNITICQASGGCNTLSVTIGGSSSNNNSNVNSTGPILSPASISLSAGSTQNVSISGNGSSLFISSNSNGGVATAVLNNGTLTVTGVGAGTNTITVCQNGGCNDLSVTVTGTATPATTPAPVVTTPTVNTTAPVGNISGLSSAVASTLLAQITSMKNQINQLLLQLTQLETAIRTLGTVSSLSSGSGSSASINAGYKFYNPLAYGDSGSDVTELQKRLIAGGYLSGTATGYFGSGTEQALKKYQTAHGLTPLGTVGPGTRAELNK